MATTLETLALSLDARRMKTGADVAERSLHKVGRAARRAGRNMDSAENSAVKFGRTLFTFRRFLAGAGIGLIGAQALKASANFETLEVSLTSLTGSAEQTAKIIGDLQELTRESPFRFEDLTRATRLMIALGGSAETAVEEVSKVVEAASRSGEGADALLGIVRALGQIRQKGKLSAEEVLQLAERGVGAWQILADAANTSVAEIQEATSRGLIEGEVAVEALLKGFEKFSGTAAAQADTLAVQWQNLGGHATRWARRLGDALAEFVLPVLKEVNQALEEIEKNTTKPLSSIEQVNKNVKDLIQTFSQPVPDTYTGFTERLQEVDAVLQQIRSTTEAPVSPALARALAAIVQPPPQDPRSLIDFILRDPGGVNYALGRARRAFIKLNQDAINNWTIDDAINATLESLPEQISLAARLIKRELERVEAPDLPFIGPAEPPSIVPDNFLFELRSLELQQQAALERQKNLIIDRNLELASAIADPFTDAFAAIISGTESVSEAFANMSRDILASLARILLRRAVINPLLNAIIPGAGLPTFTPGADGLVVSPSVPRLANGGIVSTPTAIIGEAGPEAVLPLKRMPSGQLGVQASGSGAGVTQNFYINTPDVSGFRRSQRQIQRDMRRAL